MVLLRSAAATCAPFSSVRASARTLRTVRPREFIPLPEATSPTADRSRRATPRRFLCALTLTLAASCAPFVKPALPGETPLAVREVRFAAAGLSPNSEGAPSLDPAALRPLLALRPRIGLIAGQPWNPFRAAEDRRRIAAFWKNHGYFDVEVAAPEVQTDVAGGAVDVTWRIREGRRYTLCDATVSGHYPEAFASSLRSRVTQRAGDPVEVIPWRLRRHALADVLREGGHLRAEVYSRAWIDRQRGCVTWAYLVDAGPPTVVGRVTVSGASRVPPDVILARVGLTPGEPLDLETHAKRELDLADTGAFQVARVVADTGTEFQTGSASWETWIPPDTGGILREGQVAQDGRLVPRDVAAEVDLAVTVVEAPRVQASAEVGVMADVERVDPWVGGRVVWRDALGALHHVTAQARVGWGLRWRGALDEPLGLHGGGRLAWSRSGLLGRTGDLRLVLSSDDRLHPGFNWRTSRAAVGARWLLARGMFLDLEPALRRDAPIGLGDLSSAETPGLSRNASDLAGELRVQWVWDTRNDPVEALDGHFIALRGGLAPVGTSRWLGGGVDLRWFWRLSDDLGLAVRASWEGVSGLGGSGVPVGVRPFGGGAWGMRGFGTRRLAVMGEVCASDLCRTVGLGAESLLESSLELRWLPFRKQFGAVAFLDAGGAGAGLDPLGEGLALAPGLGLRARLWHLTLSLDVAWRALQSEMHAGLDRWHAFLRIGEAF
jgi:hypothetical protein